jgi:hypothetical protein
MFRFVAKRLVPAALLFAFAAAAVVGPAPFVASASSHREAPLISNDPQADNTDVYAFVSPDRQDAVTLIGDWIPFEAPDGGPNYFRFADEVDYAMHVDTLGDAKSHVTYHFKFTTHTRNPNTFLYNTGTIHALNDTNWNVYQTYTVTEVVSTTSGLTTTVLASDVASPPVNIGSKSTPNYDTLGDAAVCTIGISGVSGGPSGTTCNTRGAALGAGSNNLKVFAGQRDDPFFVDLQVFDLLTLRGQPGPIGYTSGNNIPLDGLKGFNVHSIALQIPISRLTGANSLTGNNPNPIIGVWATSARPSMRVLSPGGETDSGPMVQISRLGMPLTNEVVMPLALKDAFNGLAPEQDLPLYVSGSPSGNLFKKSVENPELGTLLCSLYGVPLPREVGTTCNTGYTTPATGRADLFDIFLTGMTTAITFTVNTAGGPVALPPGFNVNKPAGVVPAEMLRLNTSIKGATCAPVPSTLGVLGGDACGFPNGRRLTDDVTDISLLAVGGAAWQVLVDNSFSFNSALINNLTDRVNTNDVPFGTTFPYVASPHAGQDPQFANIFSSYFASMFK